MRNITVSVDEETYRRARLKAAEQDTSVSRIVRDYLRTFAAEESSYELLQRREKQLRDRVTGFSATDRLGRDELHSRER